MSKLKKGLLITAITLIAVFAIFIICISPITKYLIEKYDVKYLGREIKIGWLYLNPFTAYVHIGNLKVYEADSDSLFLTAEGLSADFQLHKLFSKTYEINTITLNKPVAYIIQNKKELNFSDLIRRFTPKTKRDSTKPRVPVHFNILDIEVIDGEFHYIELTIPINYYVKHVNISSPGKSWDNDSMNYKFSLESGSGAGKIQGDAALGFDSLNYRLAAKIEHFDLGLINQYLQDLTNYSSVSAFLDADIKAEGGIKDELDFNAKAFVAISDFHFGKNADNDFASFDKLVIDAEKISPRTFQYYIDSIMIAKPFFMYERYDKLNNIERMFGKGGSKIKQANAESDAGKFNLIIEVAKFVEKIAKNFLKSYYKINKVAIYNGDIHYNDFALREKFSISANPLFLKIDSADKNKKRFTANIKSDLKPYGKLAADISIDPNNYGNFNLKYSLLNVPVSLFNPYVVTYTSFPLDRGKLEFTGFMDVVDSAIKSENHLLVIDPRVAKRVKKKDTKWIPVPLIMWFARSSGNAIDFQIPIAGTLGDPKFKFWPIIGEVVKNIFVKPPSSLYLYIVKQIEQEIENSFSLKWLTRQSTLSNAQEKFLSRIADFLKDNPEASITIEPISYESKEVEQIILYEAKKLFYTNMNGVKEKNLSEDDSIAIDKMSTKDPLFVAYLDKRVGDSSLFTVQEKCIYILSESRVANIYALLLKNREQSFRASFKEFSSRVKFVSVKSSVPFNGFSNYRINYNGEIPEKLREAYLDMQDINEMAPRKKYKEKRRRLLR